MAAQDPKVATPAPAPPPPQIVIQSDQDSYLEKLDKASVMVKASDTMPDVGIDLPDACLRRRGGTRQRVAPEISGSGWMDYPVKLSDGTMIGYIEDDQKAYHYAVYPLTHRYVARGVYFPVSRNNHPDLKPHETDLRGFIKMDANCYLCWTFRSNAKMIRREEDGPYASRVVHAADSGTQVIGNPVFRSSKTRRKIGAGIALDKEDIIPSKDESDPPDLEE